MKTIYYVPPVLALAIAAAWYTSQKPSDTGVKQEEVKAKSNTASLTSRPPVVEEKPRTNHSQRKTKDTLAQPAKPESADTVDPASVLRDETKWESYNNKELAQMLVRWMQTDPAAAKAWMQSQPKPYALVEITNEAIVLDQAATIELVDALPDDSPAKGLRMHCMFTIFSKIDDQDAFAAKLATFPATWQDGAKIEWYSKFEHGPDNKATAEELKTILNRDPNIAHFMQSLKAVDKHLHYYTSTGNYDEGFAWAMSLPPGLSQRQSIGELTNDWVKKDPAAAANWINQQPQGEARDQSTSYLIEVIRDDQPAIAFQWAQSISNEEKRNKESAEIYETWKRINPEEAQKAMDALPAGK
jgi:hypothetical protein